MLRWSGDGVIEGHPGAVTQPTSRRQLALFNSMLDDYTDELKNLRTDRNPARWPAVTRYRAPHKPFLLLTVFDLVAQGILQTSFVEFNSQLVDGFDHYWLKIMGTSRLGDPVLPFYHLGTSRFWHLVPIPGREDALSAVGQVRSTSKLRELVLGARLDDEFFKLLTVPESREALRTVLFEAYFAPRVRPDLADLAQIAVEASQYATELHRRVRQRFELRETPAVEEQYRVESRSTAFRRVVVAAYDHTCAMCGVRLRTPEGRTAVAAAHIVPWTDSHNDDPRNGIALCADCIIGPSTRDWSGWHPSIGSRFRVWFPLIRERSRFGPWNAARFTILRT